MKHTTNTTEGAFTMNTTEPTAIRTWKNSKATITVTLADERVITVGGKRAERAEAIVFAAWDHKPLGLVGARADAHAAEVEVNRLLTATTRKERGGSAFNVTPCSEAISVPVTEANPVPDPMADEPKATKATAKPAAKAEPKATKATAKPAAKATKAATKATAKPATKAEPKAVDPAKVAKAEALATARATDGCREAHYARTTGSLVALYDLGKGTEGGRWSVVCHTHDTTVQHESLRPAEQALSATEAWCKGCKKAAK